MVSNNLNLENYLNKKDVNFPVGTTVVEEGNHFNGIYYVKKGRLKILKKNSLGEEILIQLLSPGEFIGLATFFNEGNYQITAITQEPCKLIYIKPDEFKTLLNKSFDIKKQLMIVLINRIKLMDAQSMSLLTPLPKHLLDTLSYCTTSLENFKNSAKNKSDQYLAYSESELASNTRSSNAHIEQILSELSNRKLIDLLNSKELLFSDYLKLIAFVTDTSANA